MYCFIFKLVDHLFLTLGANYIDFPKIYDQTQENLKKFFEQKPTSFEELYALAQLNEDLP